MLKPLPLSQRGHVFMQRKTALNEFVPHCISLSVCVKACYHDLALLRSHCGRPGRRWRLVPVCS